MLVDIVEVKPLASYKLFIKFEDGVSGEIDLTKIVPFKGIFAKLADREYFNTVYVNKDIGTICWDNGADLSSCVIYEMIHINHQK